MSGRISTQQIFSQNIQSMLRQQQASATTQQQISTGEKLTRPSDDPLAAVRLASIERNIEKNLQYQKNAEAAQLRLRTEEGVLGSSINIVQHVRDLALQGLNGSNDNDTRQLIAEEVAQQLDALMQLANTQDANGDYLFSGFQGETQAFVDNGTSVVYQGDQGERLLKISQAQHISDSDAGDAVFMAISQGNGRFYTAAALSNAGTGVITEGEVFDRTVWAAQTHKIVFTSETTYDVLDDQNNVIASDNYVEGASIEFNGSRVSIRGEVELGDEFVIEPSRSESIFATMSTLQLALAGEQESESDVASMINSINHALSGFDRALENFNDKRTGVGIRLNAVDRQQAINTNTELDLREMQSSIKDIDFAEAISRYNRQLLVLQAAQQSFVRMQGMSLFNYIS